jgi:hypothetical protein
VGQDQSDPQGPAGAPGRTIGQLIAGMDVWTAGVLGALVLVVIGSFGPWVTSPLSSASGANGDGKWTALLALIAAVQLVRGHRGGAAIACVLIAAVAIYDAIHINHAVANVRFAGVQLDHVGWGVYVVIAGAVIALAILYRARSQGIGETLRAWTRKQI